MVTATTGDARAGEAGFTLVELLVAATLMLVVVAGSLTALTSLQRSERKTTDRASVLTAGRTALERMTRELRQASKVYTPQAATAATIKVSTYVHESGSATATLRDVTYSCATSICTRTVANTAGTTLSTNKLQTGQTNADVFAWSSTTPNRIDLKLVLDLEGTSTITLTDGVDLRNAA